MDFDLERLQSLNKLELNLGELLDRISEEIYKNEVQWMHLRYLVKPHENEQSLPNIKSDNVDNDTVDEIKLDLTVTDKLNLEEEEEDDA